MNVPLVVAGAMSLAAAAVHGVGGEILVVRKLSLRLLPPSAFGGPGMTRTMIRATWHMTTIAFLTVGSALVAAGSVLQGEVARGVGLVAACGATGFAAVAVGALFVQGPRSLRSRARHDRRAFLHPAPAGLAAAAVLAWVGLTG